MVGLSDLTAPYQAAVHSLLSDPSAKVDDRVVLAELQQDDLKNAAALETAFRHSFYNILATCDIDDDSFSAMWRLLDAINIASDGGLCEPGLPFLLVEELLDSQTIHGCRKVFDYLESRRERMIARHWKAKHLVILRSCNELLRRLSRAEDTVFCGRVFIFLFQSFPLGDKSSVNLRGEYHTDNVTQYDHAAAAAAAASLAGVGPDDSMDVDENNGQKADGEESAPAATGPPAIKVEGEEKESVDADALYPTFWALQEFFAQPTKLFESSTLESFKSGLESTLKKFKEVYRDEPRSTARSTKDTATNGNTASSQGVKRKLDNLDGSDTFNPRYLTSRDLFELEIHDPAFRRHILVQAVIAVDFLLSQTPKAKAKLENLKNRSVIYDFVLGDADAQWAAGMRADIAAYLQQGPEGKFYYRMVDTVLARDKNWLRWKAESCPPFQLEPEGAAAYGTARQGVVKAAAPRALRKPPMGALDVSFLDEKPVSADPLQKYADPVRAARPDLDSFRGAIMDAGFDLDMARDDDDERAAAQEVKSSNVWRALRVGARFSILDRLDDGNNLDPLFGIASADEDGENDGRRRQQTDGADDENEGEDEEEEEGAAGADDITTTTVTQVVRLDGPGEEGDGEEEQLTVQEDVEIPPAPQREDGGGEEEGEEGDIDGREPDQEIDKMADPEADDTASRMVEGRIDDDDDMDDEQVDLIRDAHSPGMDE